MGGGNGEQVSNEPWSGQQPHLQNLMGDAQALYQSGVGQNLYPGNQVAPFAPQTQMGFDMLMNRAGGTVGQEMMGGYLGQSMANNGTPQMAATSQGAFLGSNPYLDQVYDKGAGQIMDQYQQEIMPGLNATFGGAGRANSGMHQLYAGEAAGEAMDSLGNLSASIYAPAYEAERDRMMQASSGLNQQAMGAAGLMPTYDQMQRGNIQDVLSVGGALENQSQRMIDANMNQWNFNEQAPWMALGNYGNAIYGLPGAYGQTSTSGGPDPRVAGALGGAAAGSSFGPYGAAIGGALGYFMA